jgi:hypothetical protein
MPSARINGIDLFYEIGGRGSPAVYVHGGFAGLDTVLRDLQPHTWGWEQDFAGHFQFVVYDRRGCYRSSSPPAGYDLLNGMGMNTIDPASPLAALQFLLGEWEAVETPDHSTGGSSFSVVLLGQAILRANFADYPATAERPAFRHEDLLIIRAGPDGALLGDYFDSGGHAIRYAAQASERAVTLVSAPGGPGPGFRLSYWAQADGTLAGSFEIAPPGQPGAFAPYLAWTARRTAP